MSQGTAYQERIKSPQFRQAVDLIDSGEADQLRALLEAQPQLVSERVHFRKGGYFSDPSLLEFIAENPIRHGAMPANICEVAKVILEAGAKEDQEALDSTLGLVSTGSVAREQGRQADLIRLLTQHGADPNTAVRSALLHMEVDAARLLMECGAKVDLQVAAALDQREGFERLLTEATTEERQVAITLAAMYGNEEILLQVLKYGDKDVSASFFNPKGAHAHSTPLHQIGRAHV